MSGMKFEVVDDEQKAMTVKNETRIDTAMGIMGSSTQALIQYALENDKGMDVLERMIALKNDEETRQAKKDFDLHFAEMQKDFKPVKRNKEAKNNGKVMYTYAPIEALQSTNGEAIARHGFSYSWKEGEMEKGRRYTLVISGWGYSKETTFDIPTMTGTSMMNPAQAAASMSTYGRRNSLMLGFGMVVEDEDDDTEGFTLEDGIKYGELIKAIRESKTVEDLKKTYFEALRSVEGDDQGKHVLTVEKDAQVKAIKGIK